jgi:hypothetical protein
MLCQALTDGGLVCILYTYIVQLYVNTKYVNSRYPQGTVLLTADYVEGRHVKL